MFPMLEWSGRGYPVGHILQLLVARTQEVTLPWRGGVVYQVHVPGKVKRKDYVSILHTAWFLKLWDATYCKKSHRVANSYLKCSCT
jgi:hypothetical protein